MKLLCLLRADFCSFSDKNPTKAIPLILGGTRMEAGLRGAKKGLKSFFFVLKGRFDNLTVNKVFNQQSEKSFHRQVLSSVPYKLGKNIYKVILERFF